MHDMDFSIRFSAKGINQTRALDVGVVTNSLVKLFRFVGSEKLVCSVISYTELFNCSLFTDLIGNSASGLIRGHGVDISSNQETSFRKNADAQISNRTRKNVAPAHVACWYRRRVRAEFWMLIFRHSRYFQHS
jgi:hypothetical protein